ncbi:cupin domain-containing protein [Paucidesulfovibrio longus]|uniref:cupin domain-containing protein n=1 Tax=Paucidesulfovibrio longus TaxID=889 RepID=UPI0003B35734|nr:cupin domain-containing protein [Paucidesulfovibrio longus]
MIAKNVKEVQGIQVKETSFKGQRREVKGVTVRWLSKAGRDAEGQPEYGLRHFTVEPGGVIPAHDHFYLQTMFIESGEFECYAYDPETGEPVESRVCRQGDWVYTSAREPHGMRNMSATEPGTFLCCICNVYSDEDTL